MVLRTFISGSPTSITDNSFDKSSGWNEVSGLFRFDTKTKSFEKEEDISDYLDILNFFTNSLLGFHNRQSESSLQNAIFNLVLIDVIFR